ncbi:MAG: isochorismatase family protein [Ferrovibrionaceae bacterium]
MDEIYDADLVRLLVGRRGRLHAFPAIEPGRTAVVVLDAVPSALDGNPIVTAAIETLAAGARAAGATICWIKPTPPASWRSSDAADAILGGEALALATERMEPGAPDSGIADGLCPEPSDWMAHKAGYSAFFPGNCSLPDWLGAHGLDTVVLAGSGIAATASARDAFEAGFRVIVCSDATAVADTMVMRDIARDHGDVRPAADIVALMLR